MDLFVLDKSLDSLAVIDTYDSMIWTDRFREYGDFELHIRMRHGIFDTIKQDFYLWSNHSEHSMIIEKILIESDIESGDRLTVTGRSLESILDRRVIWGLRTLKGNLQNGIKTLLNECIINPSKPERKIENFIFEESNDPAITSLTIDTQYTGDNLYDVIKNICEERDIGFKITINDKKQFVFKLYSGTDHSYSQFRNPYVVFSPKFDNIIDSNYVESKAGLKNVTLVGGEGEGNERRYTAVGSISGLDRREVFTDARDISSDSDDDITELFDFTQYPSQVFDNAKKSFVTDANFNSCMIDISAYAGRTISISIPQYTNASGAAPNFATILVNSAKQYVSTLKVWEKYDDETANRGSLTTYEILLPRTAQYLYTSMFSQKAIDGDIYYGDLDDFGCQTVKLSNAEYISLLRQRGKETLSENRDVVSFEGKAETSLMFRYGEHFTIGDLVEVGDNYGHGTKARILEFIVSQDEEGESMYPTFMTVETEPEEPDDLPDGYTRLAYIESSGTQYIDADFKPNQDTRVVMDVKLMSQTNASACLFGTRNQASATATLMYNFWSLETGKSVRSDYFISNISAPISLIGTRITIDKDKDICQVGDVILKNNVAIGQTALNLYLFTCNNVGAVNTSLSASARLYSCKIYENGTLVRNFIPCIDPEGTIGLFDAYGQKFYRNAGTGNFVAGYDDPEDTSILPSGYTELEYIESSGTQYIDTRFKPNHNTRVSMDVMAISSGVSAYFGTRDAVGENSFILWLASETSIRSDYSSGDELTKTVSTTATRLTIDKNKNITNYGDAVITHEAASFSCSYNLALFTQITGGSVDERKTSARLYSCRVYDNGFMIREYIPCINLLGEIGLYDLIGKEFYGNAGTGVFIAGKKGANS